MRCRNENEYWQNSLTTNAKFTQTHVEKGHVDEVKRTV